VSQGTLWEKGHTPGRRVATLAGAALVPVAVVNLLVGEKLDLLFDVGFVLICLTAAFSVRPRDLFVVGVLPPLLMLGANVALALLARRALAEPGDGLVQTVVSGLAHHAGALVVGYGLTLVVLALRQMARQQLLPAQTARRRRHARTGVPVENARDRSGLPGGADVTA